MSKQPINNQLLRALERVIRPLARLLLLNGIPLQMAIEMLKQALVDSAEEDFTLKRKTQTDSRISLLTGVHRKDVKRLRQRESSRREAPAAISLGARLVSHWLTFTPYADENEKPRPLARLRSRGDDLSFEALSEQVSKDIRSRALLDELLRVGAVSINDDDQVILNAEAFIPSAGSEERLYYLGRAVGDHLEAASRNVTGVEAPFLDRIVHYDTIPQSALSALRAAAEKSGMQALKSVNKKAMEASMNGNAGEPQRITFGMYFYAEPASSSEEEKEK